MANTDDSLCNEVVVKVKNKIQHFGDESSLHGVGYVFSMSPIPFFKRLFWLIILVCCCLGAAAILRGALSLYSGDVVSYSVETNYLNFDTPFPAVTVCEQLDGGSRAKPYLIKNNLSTNLLPFLKETMYFSLVYCRTCKNCQMNTTCVENFLELLDIIRLNCTGILTDCWWDGQPFHCCDRFLPIPTEYGVCFVFNSRLTSNESSILSVNQSTGLPILVFTAIQNVQLRIHAPDEMVSTAMENILGLRSSSLALVTDFTVDLKAEQTISDPSVTSLTPAMRGCLFSHEQPARAPLWPYRDYTYTACLLYCKALAQVQFCNCSHHFMPRLDPLRNVKCDCPMGCEEIFYKVVHIHNVRYVDNVPKELSQRGTRAIIRLAQLPTLRVLRHAIRDMLGLVVDIGGVGGVFFGASLLSVIEIVYLFCIRRWP